MAACAGLIGLTIGDHVYYLLTQVRRRMLLDAPRDHCQALTRQCGPRMFKLICPVIIRYVRECSVLSARCRSVPLIRREDVLPFVKTHARTDLNLHTPSKMIRLVDHQVTAYATRPRSGVEQRKRARLQRRAVLPSFPAFAPPPCLAVEPDPAVSALGSVAAAPTTYETILGDIAEWGYVPFTSYLTSNVFGIRDLKSAPDTTPT